jgi:PPOX class probable F420-dependent enzyme
MVARTLVLSRRPIMPVYPGVMPEMPLPGPVIELLRLPNPAVMATVAADGRPVSVATWYLLEDDRHFLLGLDAQRARLKHMRADPRVSLTVLARDDWYTHVSLQGRVISLTDDVGLRDIDRLARHYTGDGYANRERPRVSAQIEIERWHAWGALREQ